MASRCSSRFACSQPGPGLLPLSSFPSICSGRLSSWLNRSGSSPSSLAGIGLPRQKQPPPCQPCPQFPDLVAVLLCVAHSLIAYVPVLIRHPFKHLKILIVAKAEPWTASASSYFRFCPSAESLCETTSVTFRFQKKYPVLCIMTC